jgi:predicted GNAT family N-acyltransferase
MRPPTVCHPPPADCDVHSDAERLAVMPSNDDRAAPLLGQGPRRGDALRTAQAAGRGFVVEQAIAYPELDGRDLLAQTHHFGHEGPDGEVISTLRLLEEHPRGEKVFRTGRVCTKKSARRHGHTNRLLQAALADLGEYPGHITAQTYLDEMYGHHGFIRDGANSSTASRTCPWSSRDVTGLSVQRHRRP